MEYWNKLQLHLSKILKDISSYGYSVIILNIIKPLSLSVSSFRIFRYPIMYAINHITIQTLKSLGPSGISGVDEVANIGKI